MNFGDSDFVYLDEAFDDGFTIQANEVGIGGDPADGGAKLQVFGNITATGTITPSSDRNLKKHFDPVDPQDHLVWPRRRLGNVANLEFDMMAKYAAQILAPYRPS